LKKLTIFVLMALLVAGPVFQAGAVVDESLNVSSRFPNLCLASNDVLDPYTYLFQFYGVSDTLVFSLTPAAALAFTGSFTITDADGAALITLVGFEASEAQIRLNSDQDDDATDGWEIAASVSGTLTIGNDSSTAGTYVDKLTIAGSTGNVTLTGDIVNEGADTLVMSGDDTISFESNDEASTIQAKGFEAKDAILILDADEGDDAADTWTFKSEQSGNDLSILNAATEVMNLTSAGNLQIDGIATFSGGQTRKVLIPIEDVELDGASAPAVAQIGTNGQAVFPALQFDADGGATGDDIAYLHWVVPDGYVVDSARLNVYYSFSDAEDAADEAQFDFTVNAVAAGEALDAAGTAFADQTTVITDGSTDNGKLHITQYNIEVEEIAVDDLVTIEIAVDESASALSASATLDVQYFEIEWESTE
jgi:hypothetical protein|tara:strand:- start:1726 stop:2991 length:1266 start_codon:yes stop_codon:yes gene_type:complete